MSALINVAIDYRMRSLHCERLADIVRDPTETEVENAPPIDHLVPRIELRGGSFRYSETEPWWCRTLTC